jgi:hypothetical protein
VSVSSCMAIVRGFPGRLCSEISWVGDNLICQLSISSRPLSESGRPFVLCTLHKGVLSREWFQRERVWMFNRCQRRFCGVD